VLALGGGKFAQLSGEQPQLADVTATGRVLAQTGLGARKPTGTRVLACGRDGRLAAAWVDDRGDALYRLRVRVRSAGGAVARLRTPAGDGRRGNGDRRRARSDRRAVGVIHRRRSRVEWEGHFSVRQAP
jgi:hypothetical protein